MLPTMDNKPLQIPDSKKWKGLKVFCNHCRTNVSVTCKDSGKPIKQCLHGDKHLYKLYLHVPGTDNERRTKNLGRDLDLAIKGAIDFEREFFGNKHQDYVKIGEKKEDRIEKGKDETRPHLLINGLARYVGWLKNEGVPIHMQKERTENHISDVGRAFKILIQVLKNRGYNLSTLQIENINDELVGHVFSALEERGFANRTFNKYFSFYSSFLLWYADEYDYPIKNWFARVKRKKLNYNPEAITQKEYEDLLKVITPERGEYIDKSGKKRSYYRDWSVFGMRLSAETGRRKEEVQDFKWSSIKESDGILYLVVEDFKVNRIQHRTNDSEKKLVFVPVTDSLKKLLVEMDYENNKSSTNYILAPEIENNRKTAVSEILSRSFSHYYKQLNTGRNLTYKSMRKAYITGLQLLMGNSTKAITGHSDNLIIEQNYIDRLAITKAAKNFKLFGNEDRAEELKQIREKRDSNHKNREVSK